MKQIELQSQTQPGTESRPLCRDLLPCGPGGLGDGQRATSLMHPSITRVLPSQEEREGL